MNKLYLGDNLEIMRQMQDESIDLIATDPPYNLRRIIDGKYLGRGPNNVSSYNDKSNYIRPRNSFSNICEEWHERNKDSEWYFLSEFCSPSELYYFEEMIPILQEIKRILKVGGALYWQCDYRTSHIYRIIINRIMGDKGCFRNEIIWYYPNKVHLPVLKHRFNNNHDSILFYSKLKDQKFVHDFNLEYETNTKKKMGTVWSIPFAKGNERLNYPTQKPLELYLRILKASSNENSIVLDPFAGSGTTLDAAEILKCDWIGIDNNPDTIPIIEKRLEEKHGLFVKYEVIHYGSPNK